MIYINKWYSTTDFEDWTDVYCAIRVGDNNLLGYYDTDQKEYVVEWWNFDDVYLVNEIKYKKVHNKITKQVIKYIFS